MSDLSNVSTQVLAAELQRRGVQLRCRCGRWGTYMGSYDSDGHTLRCHGCLRATQRCRCR